MQFFWSGRIFQLSSDSRDSKMQQAQTKRMTLSSDVLTRFQMHNYSSDFRAQHGTF